MNTVEITNKRDLLEIRKKKARKDEIEIIKLSSEFKKVKSKIKTEDVKQFDKIILLKPFEDLYVCVYTQKSKIIILKNTLESILKKLLKVKYKIIYIKKFINKIHFGYVAFVKNKYMLDIEQITFNISDNIYRDIKLQNVENKINKIKMLLKHFYYTSFTLKEIAQTDTEVNNSVEIRIYLENVELKYPLSKKQKLKNERLYFVPFISFYKGDYAIHFRKRRAGHITMVKRLIEYPENTLRFKLLENRIVSFILFDIGKLIKIFVKKPINLYYEKFSQKAEEGTFELFKKAKEHKKSYNFFIIDKNSDDYIKIKKEKNVIKKYSFIAYILLYSCTNFISTEVPNHTNILRSNNKYYRKKICTNKFIFLQHGITYLKSQTKTSAFMKNKEGEPHYIIVGSEKEKEVISEMQKINEEKILKTGLPIFDLIKYNHINNNSEDIVTIMLTWRPYEEHLINFEESTYYQHIIKIYNCLIKYIKNEKIYIVPHPKVKNLLEKTNMRCSLYEGRISDILEKTKLLITDYSSVCYNSFYQGGGVLFYQPDIEKFELEVGKLIPEEDEYIGYRSFDIKELEKILKLGIKNMRVDLKYFRTKKFIKNYKTINEFHDEKNIERIYNKLIELKII